MVDVKVIKCIATQLQEQKPGGILQPPFERLLYDDSRFKDIRINERCTLYTPNITSSHFLLFPTSSQISIHPLQ